MTTDFPSEPLLPSPPKAGSPEALFEMVALVNAFERETLRLFSQGRLRGTTHSCLGQEAIAAAVGACLRPGDIVFAPHRCHGHFLAYGGAPEALFAELMGRTTGVCGGRGGSQHLHLDRFFSSGVQGGIVGNAVGAALAESFNKDGDSVAVVFLGDGTLGQGLVYESLNFAALRRLPVLFVVENNRYAQTTPVQTALSGSLTARAEAFGISAHELESNDVLDLLAVFQERFAETRGDRAPRFQVIHTYRLGPHSKGDDFRDPAEIALWRQRDPVLLARRRVEAAGGDACAIVERVGQRIAAAVAQAEAAPMAGGDPVQAAPRQAALPAPWVTEDMTCVKSLNRGLHQAFAANPAVFLMGEDLLDPYGGAFAVSKGLSTKFPGRVIPSPISEAGLIAWGTGAALLGMRPVVEIMFGDFLALGADQLLNHAAKYGWISGGAATVPLVVRTPMGGGRGYGPTHSQSIESMFCGIPGLTVVAPPPLFDCGELLRRAILLTEGPLLFIENKGLYSKPLGVCRDGRIGSFQARATDGRYPTAHLSLAAFEAPDAVLIAYGGNVPLAMDAAQRMLIEHELVVDCIVPSLLAPVPMADIAAFAGRAPLVATLEEGQKPCGWGAEIVASLAEQNQGTARKYVRVAAAPCPVPAAGGLELQALPTVERVIAAILGRL
jgi:2-oxoisovalerate dehydrogenase E1 component